MYGFHIQGGQDIQSYHSDIGNSDVPYPYILTDNFIYFMLGRKFTHKSWVNLEEDVYRQYYNKEFETFDF